LSNILKPKRLDGIQAARGFAAFLVVITHTQNLFETYKVRFGLSLPKFSDHLLSIFGNSGVDIFFVISGFIIAHVTWFQKEKKQKYPGLDFFIKRLVRIVPLYWIFTTVMVFVFVFAPILIQSGKTTTLGQIIASYLFIPWQVRGDKTPILTVGWSLNYEMLFYLVFALFLRLKKSVSLIFSSLFLFFLMILGFLLQHFGFRGVWFFASTMFIEFLLGILLTVLYHKNLLPKGRGVLFSLGLILLITSSMKFGLPTPEIRGLVWGVPASLIVMDALTWTNNVPKFLVLLGNISYSLYLTHFFMGVGLARLWLRISPPLPIEVLAILELSLPCIAAYFVFRLIEKPLHDVMAKKLAQTTKLS
jgi:exopolysaccharide production protein ExoZ